MRLTDMNETYDFYCQQWYANLSFEEKAEVDAHADTYDEYDYVMECE